MWARAAVLVRGLHCCSVQAKPVVGGAAGGGHRATDDSREGGEALTSR